MTITRADIQAGRLLDQYAMAQRSFRYFLPFVKVSVPGVGMVPIEMWDYVEEVVADLETDRLIERVKARQVGFTTILSAYSLWHAMYVPNALALDFSKGERDAHEFLAKSRATWQHLPPELQIPLDVPDNREQMTFVNKGRIMALPSTEDAGRGLNPTLVIMDEADYHEYMDAAYNSVKPGLDDNGGQLIITSTVNPYKLGSLFQTLYQNAPGNGFTKKFYGWRARPGRTQEWYNERQREYQDQALFQKEFPETEEEAFAPAQAIAAFDLDMLTRKKQDVREPLRTITLGNGVRANIYQEFVPGKRYAAGTDTASGVGLDYAVTVILDVVTGYVVADIYSNVLNAHQLGVASVELCNRYSEPIWAIEDNMDGILTIHTAQELKYKRLFYREPDKPGWHTHDTAGASRGSRYVMWGDLVEAVSSGFITVPNGEGLAQFFTVIRNPQKRGKIEAQQGAHDDYPTAVAIAWQMKGLARVAGKDRGKRGSRDDGFSPMRRISRYVWG
jgi:hypothetical protein|tara:strand:- start:707 stop:2215 length:1509 start_codon:yes stop_codon:yes gene_type:complete